MEEIIALKKELRKQIKVLKATLSAEEKQLKSEQIFNSLERLPQFQQSRIVFAYWAMADEVQTQEFVKRWSNSKRMLLPKVDGEDLRLKIYRGEESMAPGEAFGILEPIGEDFTDYISIDFIVVPGVGFDKAKNRMGRGKAYYDKILNSTHAFKAGVCFDVQIVDDVPCEPHDVKMDAVFTETLSIL